MSKLTGTLGGSRTGSGKLLNDKWNIGAAHALYHKDGTWFNVLERFPGALCDPKGYILFANKQEYESCQNVKVGRQTNVPGGIGRLSKYVRMEC